MTASTRVMNRTVSPRWHYDLIAEARNDPIVPKHRQLSQ